MQNSIDANAMRRLAELGCFFIETQKRITFKYYSKPFPHEVVLAPLIQQAVDVRVFGGCCELPRRPVEHTKPARLPSVCLDIEQDLISGYEEFWYAQGWERGAVVIVADIAESDLQSVFKHCRGPGLMSSVREIKKSTPSSAINFCKTVSRTTEHTAFSLSASNGLDSIDVFARQDLLLESFRLASETCQQL